MATSVSLNVLRKPILKNRISRNLFLIILSGFALRLILVPLSFDFDLSFFVITEAGFESNRTLYETGNFYYPPVYGYILSFLTYIGNFFPVQFGSLSELLVSSDTMSDFSYVYVSSVPFASFYKIPLFVIDLACSYFIYAMVKEKTGNRKKAEWGFALFFLSPLVIWSSSVTAMFDNLSAFFMIFSLYAVIKKQNALSGIMLAMAAFTKIFPLVIGWAIVLYIIFVNRGELKATFMKLISFFTGLITAAAVILLPILVSGEIYNLSFLSNRLNYSSADGGETILEFFLNPVPDKFIYAVPLILLLITVLSLLAFMGRGDNERKLVLASAMSVCAIFVWPSIPTHPVIAVAAISLVAVYCGKREWVVPWALFSVVPLIHHILVFGNRILYSLANCTFLFDLETLIINYYEFLPMSWDIMYYTLLAMYIPGLVTLAVSINHLKNHRRARI